MGNFFEGFICERLNMNAFVRGRDEWLVIAQDAATLWLLYLRPLHCILYIAQ